MTGARCGDRVVSARFSLADRASPPGNRHRPAQVERARIALQALPGSSKMRKGECCSEDSAWKR